MGVGAKGAAIRRREDWPQRLDAAVAARAQTRFRWGRHDCCLAAVALLKAMCGADLARGLRGYTSRAGAAALLAEHGGVEGLAAMVAARHGLAEIGPAFAQRGDAAVVPAEHGDALGVVDLSGRFVLAPARAGWSRVPRKAATRAWRIEA